MRSGTCTVPPFHGAGSPSQPGGQVAHRRIEPLKKVLAMDPNDEVAWFGLGKAYMEDANFAEAITALVSTQKGDAMVTKNLELLTQSLG